MALFLLNLLYHKICMQRQSEIEVYLKTNLVGNKDASSGTSLLMILFLCGINFRLLRKSVSSVKVLDDSPLMDYLGNCTNLHWLRNNFKESDVIPEHVY